MRDSTGYLVFIGLTIIGLVTFTSGCASLPPHPDSLARASAGLAGANARPAFAAEPASTSRRSTMQGESDSEALAKQLANPVASLISVPFQLNHDRDIGPSDGDRTTLNIQPVIPISLTEDWNLISRTIVPIIDQHDVPTDGDDEFGIGDVLQSFFFSPVEPTASGWILGAGPALLLPTATDDTLGTEQFGLGPTGVALRQEGPWTYGALANHVWKIAGDDDRHDVSQTFLQPFLSYTTPSALTFTLNSESTYDWDADDLAVPLHLLATKVVDIGGQLVSVGGGIRYWAEEADNGPEGFGGRLIVTLLYPR